MRSLIVGWDAGAPSRDALALALVLGRECGFGIRIVHCYPGAESYSTTVGLIEEVLGDAQARLSEVPPEAREAGATENLIIALSPAEGLQYEAERTGAAMIVLGSTHRSGLGRIVPGAVAENLLHGAPCAVTVAPAGYAQAGDHSIRMIAAAFDGSDESRAAVDEAVRLAEAAGAGVKLIAVAPPTPFGWGGVAFSYPELHRLDRERRREQLTDLARSLPPAVRGAERLRDGEPAAEIVAECDAGVDLLILGSRGYGAVRRALLGSVSTKVMRTATCPVMVVPAHAPSDRRHAAETWTAAGVPFIAA